MLAIIAAVLWCVKLSINPERVFWATIEHSLSTHGVTVQAEQDNNGTTINQTIQYSMGANNISHAVTTLSQQGTTVTNETIGTTALDYTRYVSIKTDQKKADGSPLDVSKVEGVWAKGAGGSGQFFAQSVFGSSLPAGGLGVPVGNLSPEARAKLLRLIQSENVYQVEFSKTKKERVGGRLLYTYEATLQPVAYLTFLKEFAKSVGLHDLDQLDPSTYKSQKPFKVTITVDVRAKNVIALASSDTGAKQTYSAHDVPASVDLPKQAISGAELQKLLADLQ